MYRFKLNFAVVAIALGSIVALTQSAFTPAKAKSKALTGTVYDFNGTLLSEDKTPSYYSAETSMPSCNEADVIPCRILVPAGQSLSTWLNAHPTYNDVLSDSIDTKN